MLNIRVIGAFSRPSDVDRSIEDKGICSASRNGFTD